MERSSPLLIGIKLHDVTCPYTTSKDWNGKCPYDGKACEDPFLDSVFLGNYCRRIGTTIEAAKLLSTDLKT